MRKIIKFAKTAPDYIRKHHRPILFSFVASIFWWVVEARTSVSLVAYLFLMAIIAGVYLLLSDKRVKNYIIKFMAVISKNPTKTYSVLSVSVIVVAIFIMRFPLWNNINTLVTPETSDIVIYDLTKENKYVISTPNPDYLEGQRKYSYALLVEFGASDDAEIEIELNTGEKYLVITDWWDIPFQTNKTSNSQSIEGAIIVERQGQPPTIIKALDVQRDYSNPPTYKIKLKQVMANSSLSYYVYFESDKPLEVKSARFGDKTYHPINGQLVPNQVR